MASNNPFHPHPPQQEAPLISFDESPGGHTGEEDPFGDGASGGGFLQPQRGGGGSVPASATGLSGSEGGGTNPFKPAEKQLPPDTFHRPTSSGQLAPQVEESRARTPESGEGEGEWRLKEILWPDVRLGGERRVVRVLMQNKNGPCSLLALANVLILRGNILPPSSPTISYPTLASLIGNYLLTLPPPPSPPPLSSPNAPLPAPPLSLEAALNILPTMTLGLTTNPSFHSITAFSAPPPAGELAIFARAGVELVHGWVVEDGSAAEAAMNRLAHRKGGEGGEVGWDLVQEFLVEAGEVESRLQGMGGGSGGGMGGRGSEEEREIVEDAAILKEWLQETRSQMTYPGLFALSELDAGSIVAFFRNSHLGVLYRRPPAPPLPPSPTSSTPTEAPPQPLLFHLTTDASLASSPSHTWESLEDVDGSSSQFYDGSFDRSTSAEGDWVGGGGAEGVVRRQEREEERRGREDREFERVRQLGEAQNWETEILSEEERDLQLARAIQEEEDASIAQRLQAETNRSQRRQGTQLPPAVAGRASAAAAEEGRRGKEGKKDKKCVIQ